MSLRDRIRKQAGPGIESNLFARYGVLHNPFPAAGHPSGHPHNPTDADAEIERRIVAFERDHTSQVLVVEGTQGVGKTNLLNFYERELEELYRGEEGAYIIRYYPDPEPSFDGVLRRIFQELGHEHIATLGEALAALDAQERERILQNVVRSQEIRCALRAVSGATGAQRAAVAQAALDWLIGLRLLNRHRETLGVSFRLDTVESKTQALRDIVEASIELGCLKGVFLLLDELEKQDLTLSKTVVLRYLLAIRSLIDALPRNFFLMVAVTTEAKRRYFQMVPAFQGRLQNSVSLKPLMTEGDALDVFRFYLGESRKAAAATTAVKAVATAKSPVKPAKSTRPVAAQTVAAKAGTNPILTDVQVGQKFVDLLEASATRGLEGVTHRDFLNALHDATELVFSHPKAVRS